MFLMPPRFCPSYSTAGAASRAPCRSSTSRAGLGSVKSWTSTAPRRSITTSTLAEAGSTLTARTSPSRPPDPAGARAPPRWRATRRGQGCASWCSLLLSELQALLPLEAEFLDRKDDLTRPDRGRPEASDDVARLHAIEFAVRDVTQYRHAPCRVAR